MFLGGKRIMAFEGRFTRWRLVGSIIAALPLILLFSFVGWYKMTATPAELAQHSAWTVHLPVWLGKLVGVSEVVTAAALCGLVHPATRQAARIAALTLIINQAIASCFHVAFGEISALPQNLVLALLALAVAMLAPRAAPYRPES